MRTAIVISGLVLMIMLSACSLKPVKTDENATYRIEPTQVAIAKRPATTKTLLVNMPTANAGFKTTKMAYVTKPYELQYFTRNRWVADPNKMLMPLMTNALAKSGRYHAVVSSPYSGSTNLRLDTQLLKLQQDFMQEPSQVELSIAVQLIDTQQQKVIASRQFDLVEQSPIDAPYGGVIATNKATAKFLQQLTQFVTRNG